MQLPEALSASMVFCCITVSSAFPFVVNGFIVIWPSTSR